jgi:hypothetical protein
MLPRQNDTRDTAAGIIVQATIQLFSVFKCKTELVEKNLLFMQFVTSLRPPPIIKSSIHSSLDETFCHLLIRFAVHTSLGNYSHWNILNAKYFTQVNKIKSRDELFANDKN